MAKPPNLTRCPLFSCFVSNLTNRRIKATSHIVYIQTTSYIPDKMNKKRLWALPSCKIGFAVVYYPRQERERMLANHRKRFRKASAGWKPR